MESLHEEVVTPDVVLIDTNALRKSVGLVEKHTVGLRYVLGKVTVDKNVHHSVNSIYVDLAKRIVLVHVLDTLKHTAHSDSVGGGISGLICAIVVAKIPVCNVVGGKVVKKIVGGSLEYLHSLLILLVDIGKERTVDAPRLTAAPSRVVISALVMRRMASQPPVKHLQAGDNTNLVSSPRRSFFLFGESFPGKYELYGFWRMRKYYLRLVISAVLFAAFFVSGLYLAEMKTYQTKLDPYEYLVAYRPSNYYEDVTPGEDEIIGDESWAPTEEQDEMIRSDVDLFLMDIEAIPGVSHAEWNVSLSGGFAQSHLLLKSGQLYDAGSYTVSSKERASEGYQWAVNNYSYTVVDQLWIDNLTRNGLGTFEGDPYAVLTEPNTVIISEDIYNEKTYDFSPGDKIVVAVFESAQGGLEMVFDPRELLRLQIENFKFRYETFTVCAVVSGLNTEDTITFGVTDATYTALTGRPSSRTELKIYMEAGTDMDTVSAAEGQLRKAVSSFADWVVTPTGNYFETSIKSLKNDAAVILTLAICLLLISPMVWYFSQIMFYRKRRGEFAVLYALGAPYESFAKLHRMAGGVLSGVAFLLTIGVSLLCNYAVFFCVNTLLPKLHITESVRYEFRLSIPALVACVVISALCGFLSCELPYRMFTRKDIGVRRVD